jgi:ribosomal protein S18 acetylase RimI-like enzyme
MQDVTLRLAAPGEAARVRSLDDGIFPEHSEDLQRASAGELEAGVKAGDIYVLELDDRLAGYLHVDRTDPRLTYLSGFGVLPEFQNRGLGTAMAALARPILEDRADVLPMCAVTSPRNARMLRLLFSLRFAGRWMLPDYFGPGRHRFGCQLLRGTSGLREAATVRRVHQDDLGELVRLTGAGWAVRGHGDSGGQVFELSPATGDDFLPCPVAPSLWSDPGRFPGTVRS